MSDPLKQRIRQTADFQDAAQAAMLNLIVAADHLRERMARICAGFEITPSQYNILRILRGAHPEGYPRCEIIERTLERAPDVTRLLDRLERAGLVGRVASEADRRLSIARITPAGLALLERMEPAVEELHRYFRERVSERDRAHLSRICEGIYGED